MLLKEAAGIVAEKDKEEQRCKLQCERHWGTGLGWEEQTVFGLSRC